VGTARGKTVRGKRMKETIVVGKEKAMRAGRGPYRKGKQEKGRAVSGKMVYWAMAMAKIKIVLLVISTEPHE
jgi:hypothetical protein